MWLNKIQLDLVKMALHNQASHLAERVAPVYEMLDWHWHDVEVPTKDDIEQSLHKRIDSLIGADNGSQSYTGGLYARYEIDEDGIIEATLGMDISMLAYVPFAATEGE